MVTPSRRQRTVNPLIVLIAPLAKRRNQMIVLRGSEFKLPFSFGLPSHLATA